MTLPLLASLAIAAALPRQTVETVWIEPGEPSSFSNEDLDGEVDDDGRIFTVSNLYSQVRETTVLSYDRDAELIWSRTFQGTAIASVSIAELAPDNNGGVFIAGLASPEFPLGGPSLGGINDGFLAHLDSTGAVVWSRRIGGDRSDGAFGLAVDPSGDLFVVGRTESSSAFGGAGLGFADAFVARYSALGGERWVTRIGQLGKRERLFSVALDNHGGVVCAGDSNQPQAGLIVRVDGSGVILFDSRSFDNMVFSGVASDGNGGLAAVGHRVQSGMGAFVRANANGSPTTVTSLPPGGLGIFTSAADIVGLPGGSFAVIGQTRDVLGIDPNRAWIKLLSGAGSILDEIDLANSILGSNRSDAIATNSNGTTIAFGWSSDGIAFPAGPFLARLSFGGIGTLGCAGRPNSTGSQATLQALGTPLRSADSLTLFASGLPAARAAYFLTSPSAGFTANPGGSQGDLCLGGAIGRFRRAGEIFLSGQEGRVHLDLDLTSIPRPMGTAAVSAGDTWHYQLWYRDTNPATTSNFSSSTSVLFR